MCKDLEKKKPQQIAECVKKASNEIVKNSGYNYPTVENKLDDIFGKAKKCLDSMKKAYTDAGNKAEKNCPKN